MSWLFFSLCCLSNVALSSASEMERATLPDSLVQVVDSLRSQKEIEQVADSLELSRYERRLKRYRSVWP